MPRRNRRLPDNYQNRRPIDPTFHYVRGGVVKCRRPYELWQRTRQTDNQPHADEHAAA